MPRRIKSRTNLKPPAGSTLDRQGWQKAFGVTNYWLLNDGSGRTANDIAGINPGTFTGTGAQINWTTGKFGAAVQSDGAAGFIDFGTIPNLSGASKCSYSAWVYRSATGASNAWGRASALNLRFSTLWFTDNVIYGVCDSGGVTTAYNFTAAITKIGWHHITIVYDGTLAAAARIAIYVDGIVQTGLTGSGTIPATVPSDTSSWTWGKYQNTAFGAGRCDNMLIAVGTALRPDQVTRLYAEPFAGIVTRRNRIRYAAFGGGAAAIVPTPYYYQSMIAGGG